LLRAMAQTFANQMQVGNGISSSELLHSGPM